MSFLSFVNLFFSLACFLSVGNFTCFTKTPFVCDTQSHQWQSDFPCRAPFSLSCCFWCFFLGLHLPSFFSLWFCSLLLIAGLLCLHFLAFCYAFVYWLSCSFCDCVLFHILYSLAQIKNLPAVLMRTCSYMCQHVRTSPPHTDWMMYFFIFIFMCSCWIIAERIVEQVPIWCLYLFLHFLPRGGHAARWSQWWDVLLGWRTALLSNVRLIDFESFGFARYFGSFFRQEEFPYIKRPGWCT